MLGLALLAGIVGCGEPEAAGPAPSSLKHVLASTYDGVETLALDARTGVLTTLSHLDLPASFGALTLAVAPARGAAYLGGCAGSGGLVALRTDATTGALSLLGMVAAGTCVRRIVVHPSGGLLLALAAYGDELRAYRLDPATGALVEPAASSVRVAAGTALAIGPSGRVAYVAEADDRGGVAAFSVDPTSGRLARVPDSPVSFPSPDARPTAALVTADESFLLVAAARLSGATTGVVWSYALDPMSGRPSAAPAWGAPEPLALGDAVADRSGRFLYGPLIRPFDHTPVSLQASGAVAGYVIGAAGMLAPVAGSPFVGGIAPGAVVVEPETGFVLVGNAFARDARSGSSGASVSVYAADASTGQLSEVVGSPFFVAAPTVNALAFAP